MNNRKRGNCVQINAMHDVGQTSVFDNEKETWGFRLSSTDAKEGGVK